MAVVVAVLITTMITRGSLSGQYTLPTRTLTVATVPLVTHEHRRRVLALHVRHAGCVAGFRLGGLAFARRLGATAPAVVRPPGCAEMQ
jgi:hypothetical protein